MSNKDHNFQYEKSATRIALLYTLCIYAAIYLIVKGGGTLLNLGNTSSYLNFTEVVIELILIPIVIYGFMITLEEFVKSREEANIDIFWHDMIDQPNKKDMGGVTFPKGANYRVPNIAIHNDGQAMSIHHQVTLILPPEVRPETINEWEQNLVDGKYHLIYRSRGEVPLYPGQTEKLPVFFTYRFEEKNKLEIRFEIFSDRSKRKEGYISLAFK